MTQYPTSPRGPSANTRRRGAMLAWRLPAMTAVLAAATWVAATGTLAFAQKSPVPAASAVNAPKSNVVRPHAAPKPAATTKPSAMKWSELTVEQQQALKPLQATWPTLGDAHQRKWIALSRTYPKMSPPEQARLHSRMAEWAALSPRQRSEARLNFAETNQHSLDEKRAKWQAYQALSPEEKQKLAAKAKTSKPVAGAAPAVKPVPAQKLAVVPGATQDHKHPSIAGANAKLDHNTLLPQAAHTPSAPLPPAAVPTAAPQTH